MTRLSVKLSTLNLPWPLAPLCDTRQPDSASNSFAMKPNIPKPGKSEFAFDVDCGAIDVHRTCRSKVILSKTRQRAHQVEPHT